MQRWTILGSLALAVAVVAGCHSNTVDKSAFKTALNNYYDQQKICLFPDPMKFPAQADTNKEDQTKYFDALTDTGLLKRTPAEKKKLIGSKQVNDYDLSDKGRQVWTADTTQPGYGNFCLGSPKVTSIDTYTALDSSGGEYTVSYHYQVDLPDWAKNGEIVNTFPSVDRVSTARAATANLAKAGNGWQVQHVSTMLTWPAAIGGTSGVED